jgi:hypothetical protein
MRYEDLIDYQGGNRGIPYCQEGKGEQMSSELSSYHQGQLTEENYQKEILIIGGIQIFMPLILVEARACFAEVVIEDR